MQDIIETFAHMMVFNPKSMLYLLYFSKPILKHLEICIIGHVLLELVFMKDSRA